jgi:hypothetical protein
MNRTGSSRLVGDVASFMMTPFANKRTMPDRYFHYKL